jgi:hypothetical protein
MPWIWVESESSLRYESAAMPPPSAVKLRLTGAWLLVLRGYASNLYRPGRSPEEKNRDRYGRSQTVTDLPHVKRHSRNTTTDGRAAIPTND